MEGELEVHVVAPSERPLEKILGRELGDFVRGLHKETTVPRSQVTRKFLIIPISSCSRIWQ